MNDSWHMAMVMIMMNESYIVVIRGELSWSDKCIISRYMNLLNCCDNSMTCVRSHDLEGPICEHVLKILDVNSPKPRFWHGSDQLLLQNTIKSYPKKLRHERLETHHLWWSSSTSLKLETADPRIPRADIRTEEILKTFVTNPYWVKFRRQLTVRWWWCFGTYKSCSRGRVRRPLAASDLHNPF